MKQGLLAILGVLAVLAMAELGLRAFGRDGDDANSLRGLHEPRPDRDWLYGLRPGAEVRLEEPAPVRYAVNADGYRGRAVLRPKPDGVFRVLVLGDSVTFGYGVEEDETWVARMEAKLAEVAPDEEVELLNFGVGGYNTWNEARLLQDVGPSYEPDLVLLQFCVNDLSDPTLHFDGNTRLALGELPEEAFPDPAKRIRIEEPAWCMRSRLCERAFRFAKRDEYEARALAALAPPDGPRHRAEWTWLQIRYAEIRHYAGEMGAELAIVVFPYAQQLGEEKGPRRVQRRHGSLVTRYRFAIVDLLPPFLEAAKETDEPLLFDAWHPTPAGHRVAADATLEWLACRGLLPEGAASLCPPEPKNKRRIRVRMRRGRRR